MTTLPYLPKERLGLVIALFRTLRANLCKVDAIEPFLFINRIRLSCMGICTTVGTTLCGSGEKRRTPCFTNYNNSKLRLRMDFVMQGKHVIRRMNLWWG